MKIATNIGSIYTFYSYKGGTGRTMALANVAWLLASQGHRVLTIDWDFEAPGLHHYFAPFLNDKDISKTDGVIDWLYNYMLKAIEIDEGSNTNDDWKKAFSDISRYAEPINWKFPNNGMLEFVAAGKQSSSYAMRVNEFNWNNFYREFSGSAFLDDSVTQMRSKYDYVLIDSRTGVADTAGICTIHMPDTLVVFFTLNNQSIRGAGKIARSAYKKRAAESRPLQVFPVITRVELAEKKKLEARRKLARFVFDGFPAHKTHDEQSEYFDKMEVLYDPFYAYEEILASIADTPGQTNSVLATLERLSSEVFGHQISMPKMSEGLRKTALSMYSETDGVLVRGETIEENWDFFISSRIGDRKISETLYEALRPHCNPFLAWRSIAAGQNREQQISRALSSAKAHVVLLSKQSEKRGPYFDAEIEVSLKRKKREEDFIVLPLLIEEDALKIERAPISEIKNFQSIAMDQTRIAKTVQEVLSTIGISPVEAESSDEYFIAKLESALDQEKRDAKKAKIQYVIYSIIFVLVTVAGSYTIINKEKDGFEISLLHEKEKLSAVLVNQEDLETEIQKLQSEAIDGKIEMILKTVEDALMDAEEIEKATELEQGIEKDPNGLHIETINIDLFKIKEINAQNRTQLSKLKKKIDEYKWQAETREKKIEGLETIERKIDESDKKADRIQKHIDKITPTKKSENRREEARRLWHEGFKYFKRGEHEKAMRSYRKSIKRDSKYAPPYNSIGRIMRSQNDMEGAEEYYRKAIDKNSKYAPAYNNLAILLTKQHRLVKARESAEIALILRPGYGPAKKTIKRIENLEKSREEMKRK